MDLPERVRDTAARNGMFTPGQTAVVAVSGGPDSVALLHILYALREDLGISLVVAHLDHGFRGAEFAADAEYVRTISRRLGLPCHTAFENVPELKVRLHLSSQEAARRARHSFLRAVARETGAERIALGHTRDDRVETILLNIFRGTGADGLRGFPPVRLPLVRPLYDVSRAETAAYCATHGLEPRADASNANLDYRRNRIREELMPSLARNFNPQVAEAILRMSDSVTADSAALDQLAEQELDRVAVDRSASRVSLGAEAMALQSVALQRRILRRAISHVRGDLSGVDGRTIDAALISLRQGRRHVVQLPGEGLPVCRIESGPEHLTVERITPARAPASWSIAISQDGRMELPTGAVIEARPFPTAAEARAAYAAAAAVAACPIDALLLPMPAAGVRLAARSWQPGDRMRPRGMAGTRKLQDIFVDRKIPSSRRVLLPVITERTEVGPGSDARQAGAEKILGVLGMQGGEFSLPLTARSSETEKIGACLLIMALSHTGMT